MALANELDERGRLHDQAAADQARIAFDVDIDEQRSDAAVRADL